MSKTKRSDGPLADMQREIERELAKWNRSDVLGRHRIGQKVNQIKADEQTYGEGAVERIAKHIGYSPTWLYACGQVAETWSEEQLKEMLQERDQVRGRPLCWSHFVLIGELTSSQQRKKWVRRTLQQGLTVAQLAAELKNSPPPESQDPSAESGSLAKGIRDIRQEANAIKLIDNFGFHQGLA